MNILSTKILTPQQREILQKAGLDFQDYNAIRIKKLNFKLPSVLEYPILTSQHGVAIFLEKLEIAQIDKSKLKAFCVGEKTAGMLERNGIQVIAHFPYAKELAVHLIKNHSELHFDFFCGKIRRDTLPEAFKKYQISYNEILMYDTLSNPKTFHQDFDALLFFSPSGVESYTKLNTIKPDQLCICIGTTTAAEAQKYTRHVVYSENTTVESVLEKTIKVLKPQAF